MISFIGMRTQEVGIKPSVSVVLKVDSETLDEKVVYEHNNQIWVRDKDMFLSKVDKEKYPYVEQVYRFEEI